MTISVEKAKERLSANRYDLNAWNALIKDALDKNIDQSREFFEELITQFPTCGRFWKIYIEQELKDKNYQNAEKLFEKCLNISNIDLWKCFLGYLRETKHNENGYNKIMIEAYDSALKKIGLDVMSYSIWQDYITFLKSLEANLESDAEKQTLYESIRKTYIEAHKTPMINIDQIWKDYILFENQLNPESARKLAEEMAKGFQSIKRISREYEHITRPLERHLPALPITKLPPPPVTPSSSEESSNNSGDQEMLRQSNAWKRYILWEKRNPLNLQNHQEVMKRVLFAYEQSFLCLAYNFDIWYEAASYLCQQKETLLKKSTGDRSQQLSEEEINDLTENAAANLFNRAINSFMKTNQLIHLVYAEFEERRKNYTKVHEIYEKYLQNQQVDPTLIWIHYIRFVMRSEDITAARKMFKRAREDPRSGYHLFIAQANLEYFHTKDKTIGFKILHLGAKKFSHEPEYMLAYIKYMNHLNEDNNTRVLFERILTNDDLLPQKTNEIWSEFLKFECSVGDLASILKVDRKRQKLHDSITTQHEMTPSMLMIDRYRYLDMLPCNSNELKAVGYKDTKLTNPQLTSTNNSTNISSLATNFSSNVNLTSNEMEIEVIKRKSKFPTPDFNQMLPFKPTRNALPGMMHSIAGGVFPFPPAVTDLVKRLPPPTSFEGPFVKVDELIKKIQEAEYHEDFQPLFVTLGGESMRDLENIAASMSAALNPNLQYTAPSKRSAVSSSVNNNNNSDDEDNKKVKTMDIYKQRQYKKLIKK